MKNGNQVKNFEVIACDTDSLFFKKQDSSFFAIEERNNLLSELNSLMPEKIRWELNDYFPSLLTLKAKNYIMLTEDGKVKIKGSALKSSKIEPALKEFINEIINTILTEKFEYDIIYIKYVKEILSLKDIKRWASKRTLTEKVINGTRKNETKLLDAIGDAEVSEGDKVWVYYTPDGSLKMVENYSQDHDIPKLLKRLFDTSKVFDNIISEGTFTNFSLKNKKIQEKLKSL